MVSVSTPPYFTINSLVLNKSGSGVVRDFVLSSIRGDGSCVGEEIGGGKIQMQSGAHTAITTVDTTTIPTDPAIIVHFGRIKTITARRTEPPPTSCFRKITLSTCPYLVIQKSIFFTILLFTYFR